MTLDFQRRCNGVESYNSLYNICFPITDILRPEKGDSGGPYIGYTENNGRVLLAIHSRRNNLSQIAFGLRPHIKDFLNLLLVAKRDPKH